MRDRVDYLQLRFSSRVQNLSGQIRMNEIRRVFLMPMFRERRASCKNDSRPGHENAPVDLATKRVTNAALIRTNLYDIFWSIGSGKFV